MTASKKTAKASGAPWDVASLQKLAIVLLKELKVRGAILDIFLLKDKDIAALKARFIAKRTEPNVLSFKEPLAFPHPETKKKYLGEVYLNKDILHHSPDRAAPLLLHGILHLLGYDHIKKTDAVKMEKVEVKILENI
ncbi:MAG: rRNA maturation RNase YbeY [Candidatus Pacebacteria bacterium]|nr:rRNA maturation RNase YbeY [Candidatus Paceibacterota bacterium]